MKERSNTLYRVKDIHIRSLLKNPELFWKGIEEIDHEGFYKCNKIESIVVPGSVKRVLPRAFCGCNNLKSVVFEEGIEEIHQNPFYSTSNIERVVFPASAKHVPYSFCSHERSLVDVVINDGVESIGDKAFYFCDKLEKIVLPQSVKVLGNETFAFNDSLKEMVLGSNIQSIGEGCFQGNERLKKIHIGKNVEKISKYTFADCIRLEDIEIEEGINRIEKEAFRRVAAEKLVIPGTVEVIEDKAFSGCYNLKEIELKEGVREIGYNIFEDCKRIEKIVLPASLKEINRYNFSDSNFNYIYKTKDGKTILSKHLQQGSNIAKEYSLKEISQAVEKFQYYSILMNEEKLEELVEIINKLKKQGIKITSRMFRNFDELKEFVNNKKLFNYNRLLIKLGTNYDEYDVASIMKFANSLGMFEKNDVVVKSDHHIVNVNELAYASIKEAIKVGFLNRKKLFKDYNDKTLTECSYNEGTLLEFVEALKEYKANLVNNKVRR